MYIHLYGNVPFLEAILKSMQGSNGKHLGVRLGLDVLQYNLMALKYYIIKILLIIHSLSIRYIITLTGAASGFFWHLV